MVHWHIGWNATVEVYLCLKIWHSALDPGVALDSAGTRTNCCVTHPMCKTLSLANLFSNCPCMDRKLWERWPSHRHRPALKAKDTLRGFPTHGHWF